MGGGSKGVLRKIRHHLRKRLGETMMTEEEGSGERLQSSLVTGWMGLQGPTGAARGDSCNPAHVHRAPC